MANAEPDGPKYPKINVQLVGLDGNAFSILGRVQKAMKRAKLPKEEIEAFVEEATKGDYTALLSTVMRWVSTAGGEDEYDEDEADAEWDEHWATQDAERDALLEEEKEPAAECIECGEALSPVLELHGVNVCDDCDTEEDDGGKG